MRPASKGLHLEFDILRSDNPISFPVNDRETQGLKSRNCGACGYWSKRGTESFIPALMCVDRRDDCFVKGIGGSDLDVPVIA
jgi:hypothetical protein